MEFERNITSSFGGRIEEISNIYVDNFEERDKMAYFLSHAHSDHTVGLFNRIGAEILRRNGAKIYMSEETKTILSLNNWFYDSSRLYDIVEPLKVGMTYTIDKSDGGSFQVTMIPVTHMVGAVMFLFKTNGKYVLYTGDFIMEDDRVNELTKLHDKSGNPLTIEKMYVDATFDNEDYDHFPSRHLCQSEIVNEIERWLDRAKHHAVALFQNYKYGYDDIYKEIYRRLDIKLFLKDLQTRNTYSELYGNTNALTSDSGSKIHICENRDPDMSHTGCGVSLDNDVKYLHIYVSAQRGCNYEPGYQVICRETDSSLYLCYPTHCSRTQLNAFIDYFTFATHTPQIVKFPVNPVSTPNRNVSTPYRRERERRRREDADRDDGHVRRRLNM